MQDAQRPDHITLKSLVDHLKDGSYVVPDFQRDFEWEPSNINALMRSIFLDYFIGSLLLWRGTRKTFQALSCEPIYGYAGDAKPSHIVLDGQQRLTAIYYAIVSPDAPPPKRKSRYFYFIKVDEFMQGNVDEAFSSEWTQYASTVANDRDTQFEKHLFPLRVIGMGGWELPNWMQDYKQYWQKKAELLQNSSDTHSAELAAIHCQRADDFGDHIRSVTEKYQVSYIELDRDLELPKICDIFTQINHNGLQLGTFDLMNAMLKPNGLQLKHMWRRAEQKFNFEIPKMNGNVLQVMSILKQTYCSSNYIYKLLPGQTTHTRSVTRAASKEVLIGNSEEFVCLWDRALNALDSSLSLLINPRQYGATSYRYLPYPSILPVFAALQELVREHFIQCQSDADRKIWKWYWASIFTNRYAGSVESKCAQDFREVSTWIQRGDDSTVPRVIDEFNDRIASLRLDDAGPNSAIFKGVFNLLVLGGAFDWESGGFTKNSDVQSHYIVPRDWTEQIDPSVENSLNSVLNRMPLTAQTSQGFVRGRMPNEYFRELLDEREDLDICQILEKHCISREAFDVLLKEPFTLKDFQTFLSVRNETIKSRLSVLLEHHDTSADPSALPGSEKKDFKIEVGRRIEGVELGLRSLISGALRGKINNLPNHVRITIQNRLERQEEKNPAFRGKGEYSLGTFLEFANLSDLEAIMIGSRHWTFFANQFGSKHDFRIRFRFVTELRNAISHHRQVDDMTQADGEAGLKWFEKILRLDESS